MILILGGGGFVGSAYPRLFERLGLEHRVVTRANYDELRGSSCRVFVNANGNSKKFMADRDPNFEFDASVQSVQRSLEDFKPDVYVHLSTGDVYPSQETPDVTREDQVIDVTRVSRYGLHKHLAEQLVRGVHRRHLVMRMGGFVGPGLRKNAIHDMLGDADVWLTPQSELQFISTDAAAGLVWSLVERGVENEVVNLGAEGVVRLGDVHARIGSRSTFRPDAQTVRFELSTAKLAALTGRPLPRSREEIEEFLNSQGR